MLNRVAINANFQLRQVLIRGPNRWRCACYRKKVTRTGDGTMGGMPTLGGAGVLDSEDEEQYEYLLLGDGYGKLVGMFDPATVNERDDSLVQHVLQEMQIVSEAELGAEGFFEPDKGDLVIAGPPGEPGSSYEIVDVTGNLNIPPYTRRYAVNPRDDLRHLFPFNL